MKETEEEQKKRIVFLSSFVSGFQEQLHADIHIKPGDDGPPIPAHRALLVISIISTSFLIFMAWIFLFFFFFFAVVFDVYTRYNCDM